MFTFIRDMNQVLLPQSLNPLLKHQLEKIGVKGHSGHSLRTMTSEYLEHVANIPAKQVDKRGWKPAKTKGKSDTRRLHYSSKMTDANFAEILWIPDPQVPQSVTCNGNT